MSLKASMLTKVDLVCCVGFGLDHPSKPHLFETPLFQETLHLRSQLVSPSIRHEILFPWLKEQKLNLNISNQNIFLLAGRNDIVIGGEEGLNRIKEKLEETNNISIEVPKNLAHHEPENAGIFLKKFIQQNVLS